jgi:hypothetical protein
MAEAPQDKRLVWLGNRFCSSLKVKDDIWKAIITGESKYVYFLDFLSLRLRCPRALIALGIPITTLPNTAMTGHDT